MTTYHVARMEDGKMAYFAGFAPGGGVTTSDREHAVNFWQRQTAEQFKYELNSKLDEKQWFRVEVQEEAYE